MTIHPIDTVQFFDALATEMNAHPEVYEVLGDLDMDLAIVMTDEHGDFRVRLTFDGITCAGVDEIGDGDEYTTSCYLQGPLAEWKAMFADIVEHGHATGWWTINSLTLVGDKIAVHGDDPLGVDLFFRFNQTVQNFLDGASTVLNPTPATVTVGPA
jgi:hypothetical protein